MFLKEFKIKGKNALKTSERKNLHQTILKQYPNITQEKLREYMPLTDTLFKIRICTCKGIQLYVYLVDQKPTFFKLDYDDHLYPTVFTLWTWTSLLPSFTTYKEVWPRLLNGADLMCPGVITKPQPNTNQHKWGTHAKGQLVCINLNSNESAHAVGITALSSDDMFMSAGRGKCVKILHRYSDFLWRLCPLPVPEVGPPQWLYDCGQTYDKIAEQMYQTSISDYVNENTDDDVTKAAEEDIIENTEIANNSDNDDNNDSDNDENEPKLESTSSSSASPSEEMDLRLKYSLCKVIKLHFKSIKLPILVSTFFRNYMLPALPEHLKINIKQSSYKKLNVFLKEMQILGFLTFTEVKLVQYIQTLNNTHPDVIAFKLWDSDTITGAETKSQEESTPALNTTVVPNEFYSVTMPVLRLFNYAGYSRGDMITPKDIRKHLTFYVKEHQLAVKDKIQPDEFLESLVKTKELSPWADVINAIAAQMTPYHGSTTEKVERGKVRPIQMCVQTRSGNKKVTLVDNLELFNINVLEFAKQCQQGVGASATVQTQVGKKAQLLVQGNQIIFIHKLLTEKYKIPKNMVNGLQNAPKTKKK